MTFVCSEIQKFLGTSVCLEHTRRSLEAPRPRLRLRLRLVRFYGIATGSQGRALSLSGFRVTVKALSADR